MSVGLWRDLFMFVVGVVIGVMLGIFGVGGVVLLMLVIWVFGCWWVLG